MRRRAGKGGLGPRAWVRVRGALVCAWLWVLPGRHSSHLRARLHHGDPAIGVHHALNVLQLHARVGCRRG